MVHTNLFRTRSKLEQTLISPRMRVINFWAVQSVPMGALPTLRAAADPLARGGGYYGPHRRFYTRFTGYPALAESSARSHDVADQARLWEVSERENQKRRRPAPRVARTTKYQPRQRKRATARA